MKHYIISALLTGVLLTGCSTTKTTTNDLAINTPIEASINLTQVANDKAPVIINPGRFTLETVTYRLPRVIPGTYQVSDFGSFVDDLKAYDYSGNEIPVSKTDTNSWTINNATNLDKITYLVNDTFDVEGKVGVLTPYSMAGTNIEPDNYVLNLHGFIGYFDSLKNSQYKLDVTAASDFKRTSALQQVNATTNEDGSAITTSYFAPRYFDITDNPMMYGNLTVEEFQVGGIKIVLSVYSPNQVHSAKSLKETISKMMKAQKAYLGDINSTTRYDIYVYLSRGDVTSPQKFGALEHHTSTVVVMPEAMPDEALAEQMTDIVSHEFFHILSPLSVHSEDVHYFDYHKPTFSKHLWMYEGLTEYFASIFQIDEGLVSEEDFYAKIMDKIILASGYDDTMSFTVMSENVLKEPYKANYANVYQKGALIGMCLDILIRDESQGQRGVLSLMKELSLKYGKHKPFEDDKIIEEIVALTYPSVKDFFDTHIIGTTPINYNNFFEKVGLEFGESKIKTDYIQNAGELILNANPQNGTVFFNELVSKNSFWHEQGVQPNDVVKSVDGTLVTLQNANQILNEVFNWKPGNEATVILTRNGEDIIIKTTLTQSYTTGKAIMHKVDAIEEQIALRKAWLKG